MEQLQEIYCQYTENLQAARKATSPLAGMLGTGGGVKDHPCHTEFYKSVGHWAEAFLADNPCKADLEDAVRFILMAGAAHKKLATYWFVCAAQAHAKPMIVLLSPQACSTLALEFESLYPAGSRLPLQDEIYNLLCRGAGIVAKKKRLFSFLSK